MSEKPCQAGRVLLVGLAGPNLGDTAIAQAIYSEATALDISFRLVHPGLLIHPVPNAPDYALKRNNLVSVFGFLRLVSGRKVLVGGGSLVQDALGISLFRGVLPFALQVATAGKLLGSRVTLFGIGVDRLRTPLGKLLAKLLLTHAADRIIVRDESSRRRAAILSGHKQIKTMPDPAMAIRLPTAEPEYDLILVPSRHDCTPEQCSRIFQAIVDGCEVAAPRVCLVLSDISRAEIIYANHVRSALALAGVDVVLHVPSNVTQLVRLLASGKVIFSMRLHPMILASGDRPCVAVSDSSKIQSFASALNVPRIRTQQPIDEQMCSILSAISSYPLDSISAIKLRSAHSIRAALKAAASS